MRDKNKDKNKLKNIVAFCVLMEGSGGILDKSPDYIFEKYRRYIDSLNKYSYQWGLDFNNKLKIDKYIQKWIKEKKR